MPAILVSERFRREYGARVAAAAASHGVRAELLVLPADPAARLPEAECAKAEIAFFSEDVFPEFSRQFFSAVRKAPRLAWLHVFNAGVDHPVYAEMLARGVRLTTSSGAAAAAIAQTAIAAMLMLARNVPRWLAAQARREWDPARGAEVPRDLRGQTALVYGLGRIGNEFARLARLLGLHVIGVRRSPARPQDEADELHPPAALFELAPRADWLVVCCPLTPETEGRVDAALLARLPRGARLVNVARGRIVVEQALIAALASGHLAGAYLDVFEREPLPPGSPLWAAPNVIVTPHDAGACSGNRERTVAIFLDNLGRWARGEPLVNEVRPA
jgi:phosphoglycerate dehydrogenase-like enzyme